MSDSDDVFAHIGLRYDYYPTTAIQLCAIAYDSLAAIASAVSTSTGLAVVWGPAELTRWDGVSYSRAFIAGNAATGDYFVVVRGTYFDSLSSWLQQDFDLGTATPLATLPGAPPGVPGDALIAHGTFTGMSDLLLLRDPHTGRSMVEFLRDLGLRYLYVTGHSLGGTLAPVLFAYLNAVLFGGGPTRLMALWSFAGLTPGGAGFNGYFNSILPDSQGFLWRIQNSLDVAPLCWWSLNGIEQIYLPYELRWGAIERDLVTDLFGRAAKAAIGYTPAQPGLVMVGAFDRTFVDHTLWTGQALHQHHPATYQAMVKAQYPDADG